MPKSNFAFPGWAFDNLPSLGPTPPPSPEETEANDARVNDLNNQFIDAKQQVLFTSPQAFLRLQGADAITRAADASEVLDTLREQALDQTANVHQRNRLAPMFDWHLVDANDEINRHVARQSDAWQLGVAARTVELATRQAVLDPGDPEKVGFAAMAAYNAEKARTLKAGLQPEAAHESGRGAWSGAYRAAILAQAEQDPAQAVTLFKQARYTLDPQTRDSLEPRVEAISRDAAAESLANRALAPGADRKALLADSAVQAEIRQLAESRIATRENGAEAARKSQIETLDGHLESDIPQALAGATYVPGTYATIADGYAAAGNPDKASSARRLAANEALLTGFASAPPARQMQMLTEFEPSEIRDQALRIKDAGDRLLANDPLRWGVTTQRANGVDDLAPLDLTPSPTNTPEVIATALAKREQQARQIEALSDRPTLAMTKEEITTLKTKLDSVSLDSKQRMLHGLAGGLGGAAVARLAIELAGEGPLADGYAIALSTYGAKRPEQDALADRILDRLDRMQAAGNGGKPVADTGPEWRRAFDEKIGDALAVLDDKNAAAVRTSAAALYIQAMALKGLGGSTVSYDELDNAIRDLVGKLIDGSGPGGTSATDVLNDIAREAVHLGQIAVKPYVDFYQRSFVKPFRRGLILLAQSPLGDPGLYASLQGLGPPGLLAAGTGGLAARALRTVVGLDEAEKVAKAARLLENAARGKASEARVLESLGLVKNTRSVTTAEGSAIPDALTETASFEIKDSTYVSATKQVRIQTDAARAAGRQSVFITGEETHISKAAREAFDIIIRLPELGPQRGL